MKHIRRCATWGLAAVAILLSPVILILTVVAGIGIGLDVFDTFGKWPFVAVAAAPFVFILVRQAWPHGLAHRTVVAVARAPHPGPRAARIDYASKSMS